MGEPSETGQVKKTIVYRSASKLNLIRDKLQGYVNNEGESAGAAVVSELIQNADDARASKVIFRFQPDHLEVSNNSYFRNKDFDNISELMVGGKAQEVGKIGAFGTGFISVYHLTDTPHLLSSGRHIVFDPTRDEIPYDETDIKKETIFRFPWRRTRTKIGKAIEAKVWNKSSINEVKQQMGSPIYRLIIFLRHIRTIQVYDEDSALLFQVQRKYLDTTRIGDIQRERWSITYTSKKAKPVEDIWLYYHTDIPEGDQTKRFTIKDRKITLAFPIEERPWLTKHLAATLYNFLPTAIKTGLPFHINGAFFPDNNRRNILLDSTNHPEKTAWNQSVIHSLGGLFAAAVEDIRDQVATPAEPKRLYELLPLKIEGIQPFLKPIRAALVNTAPNLRFVANSLSEWVQPRDVRLGDISELTKLAEQYISLAAHLSSQMKHFLTHDLGCPKLTLDDVLDFLAPHLHSGARLEAEPPHPMLDSRDKLSLLYTGAEKTLQELQPDPEPYKKLFERLQELAIYLAEDGCLYSVTPEDALWRGDAEARALALDGVARFVDADLQRQHQQFLETIIGQLSGVNLLEYLSKILPKEHFLPRGSDQIPNLICDKDRLFQTLRYISRDIDSIKQEQLSGLPIIYGETKNLYSTQKLINDHTDIVDKTTLRAFGVLFVDEVFADDDAIRKVYQRAGLKPVSPERVFRQIAHRIQHTIPTQRIAHHSAPAPFSSADALRDLFEYFARHHRAQPFSPAVLTGLRKLPLYVTAGGQLAPAESDQGETLLLPALTGQESDTIPLDVLGKDILIDPAMLGGNVREFLRSALNIAEITPLVAIRDHILPSYNDDQLTDADRLVLLRFIRTHWENLTQRHDILDAVRKRGTALLRCYDPQGADCYRLDQPTYFDLPEVRRLLPYGFMRPHNSYKEGEWHTFFEALGVLKVPRPEELVAAVRQTADGPLDPTSQGHLREVYSALNRYIGEDSRYSTTSTALKELADIAWLPGEQAGQLELVRPRELCPREHLQLVGGSMPALPHAWPQPNPKLRSLLEMPACPPVEHVVAYLLDGSVPEQTLPALVRDLGERWEKLDAAARLRLQQEQVFMLQGQSWSSGQIVLGEQQRKLFGHRRGYWTHPLDRDTQRFFEEIGVQSDTDSWRDWIAFLEEIARDYPGHQCVSNEDRALIWANMWALSSASDNEDLANLDTVRRLRAKPIFVRSDGSLGAIDDPEMPLKLSTGPGAGEAAIPPALLGQGGVIANDMAEVGHRFLTSILRVDTISPFVVVRDYFARAYEQPSDHTSRC